MSLINPPSKHATPNPNERKYSSDELRGILSRFKVEIEKGTERAGGCHAAEHYERACEICPEAFFGIASENFKAGRTTLAFDQFALVLKHAKRGITKAHALNNIGMIQSRWQEMEKARITFDEARQLDSKNAAIAHNIATIEKWLGNFTEAEKWLYRAGNLDPRCYEVAFGKAELWLLQGDYLRGFSQYECRWNKPGGPRHYNVAKQWTGQDLKGKSIFIYSEQGAGDVIMMLRYIPLLAERGAKVWLEVAPPLERLIESWWGVFCHKPINATADYELPLMSLPLRFRTTPETVPASPYLIRKNHHPDNRIGICWAGSMAHAGDAMRSLKLADFAPLFDLPFEFASFQVGPAALELALHDYPITDLQNKIKDYQDTADLLSSCRYLVSCDTSIVHLAGALGVPTLLLVPKSPDWRWGWNWERSPWYKDVQIIRSNGSGWASAMTKAKEILSA